MSSRRSSRSAKPVVMFTDTEFVGSYDGKRLAMKEKAQELEAIRKANAKAKAEELEAIKKENAKQREIKKELKKKKAALKVSHAADISACVASSKKKVVLQVEDVLKAPKKSKFSRRKPPK